MSDNLFPSFASAVEPPITVPYFWWKNGNVALKQVSETLYYGGWLAKAEEVMAAASDNGYDMGLVEANFEAVTMVFEHEGEVPHFGNRALVIAPIAFRKSWFNKELRRRSPSYFPGSRQHVQVLTFLGIRDAERVIHPWGIVVLSAKGFNGGYLLQALRKSLDATRKACRQFGVDEAPHTFWHMVGTFGPERTSKTVGKGQTSTITPIMPHLAPIDSKERLMVRYVGDEVKAQMVEALASFRDWLDAWNEESGEDDEAQPHMQGAAVMAEATEDEIPW